MSGATRKYDFVSGIQTASPLTATDPSVDADVMLKGYADAHYAPLASVIQGTGTYDSPQAIVNNTALAFSGTAQDNIWFIVGSGGAVALNGTLQIAAPTRIGQQLEIFGGHDTNTVSFADGAGLIMNGPCVLQKDKCIRFRAVSVSSVLKWLEAGRS